MLPVQLKRTDFAAYPPQGGQMAVANLELLRQLPVVLAAILLREVITYDWKFTAERRQVEGELRLLAAMQKTDLASRVHGFEVIRLSPQLEGANWIGNPAGFMEQLTAWLWSTQQMEDFRKSAEVYGAFLAEANPSRRPTHRRLGMVVVGQGAQGGHPLFRKLRPHGVYLENIRPGRGLEVLLAAAVKRGETMTEAYPQTTPHTHWYIDGGNALATLSLTRLSYQDLHSARTLLLNKTQEAIASGAMGPEGLRSMLAQMKPEDIGLDSSTDRVLSHFALSVLTEGSGTQIFATTFAQWAARECLRRAQPETLLVRYAPRQEMQPMNVMLSGATASAADPQGSLIDADMGAYYTWLNMRRLSGADEMSFLAWFEGHSQAVAIGPGLPQGTTSANSMDMHEVLALMS